MRVIDLDGPDGNAFFLLGQARKWSKELGFNPCDITTEMTSGDYTHLCKTFLKYFGTFANLETTDPELDLDIGAE